MTTYTKETALYDTGAIAGDIQEAGAQVSKYITAIGDEGIKVHPYDATQGQADTDNYAKIDSDGMEIWQKPTGASASVKVAEFGAGGAQIGQSGGAHSVIDANGQRFYASNGATQLANIGYGSGTGESGTAIAPYYTFGIRASDTSSTRGNYSVAEGYRTTASDYAAHAEGYYTTASEQYAHAEGANTTASGDGSHTEGHQTTASGFASHAEGFKTTASGSYSHAQNSRTIAQRLAQTAIGAYNIADTTGSELISKGKYLFIIGNGTSDTDRSNALTVDWDGNVEAAGEIHGVLANPTISITASTGTLQSATVYRQGNVVQLLVSVRKTSATASGQNVFEGTINTTALRPKMITTSGTYYVSYALNATISTAGVITIRNSDSRQLAAMTANCNISFTYLID